ncbi:hypothetical protein [Haladaptatus sp. CMAA 1911]|uniref:hypothetical protein n=1 Tax=unclassified Haladaptatus TaxID=2622732 RepID=UPI003755216E
MKGMVCQGVMTAASELVNSFFDKLLKTLQQGAEELVKMLINRPVPERNGNPAFAGQPTNEPMKTAYNVWLNTGLVGGLILWAFFMLLRYFSIGAPNAATGTQASAKKQLLKGSFDGLNILASWILAAIVLHLSVGFALWVAPEGPQIIESFDTLINHASAVGVAALILWFSSGFIFAMAVIVFGLGIVAPLLLAPMQPIFIGLSMTPRIWLFKYIAEFGDQARGWFVPAAFAPVPTAMILGFGYPILNAFRGAMSGPFESFVGVPTYVIGLVIMWFAALSAPMALFAKSRHVRPLAMAGMAAAGAMSGISMSNRLSGLRNRFSSVGENTTSNAASSSTTGMGTAAGRVDPIKGNPLAGDTSASASGLGSADSDARSVGSGASSALGGGSSPPVASQSASGSETATPSEASAIGAGEASGTTARTSGSTTSETSESAYTRAGSSARSTGTTDGPKRTPNATAGSSDDEKITVADRGIHEVTTSEELPTGQRYEGGYERSDGLYENALDNFRRRNFLLQRYDSLAIHNFDGPMLLKGEEDGQFYDVTTAVEEGRVPNGSATHEESQNVVQNTR